MPTLTLLAPPFFPSPKPLCSKFKPQLAYSSNNNPISQCQPHQKTGVVIIGAGLAGLAAATRLNSENISFLLVEASDNVGGRVRTDIIDGFLLDRGFQIFITAYPETRKLLDYRSLNLRSFYSSARVYFDGEFHTVCDPFRHFSNFIMSLADPIGSLLDKLLIGLTEAHALTKSDVQIMTSDEIPTFDLLKGIGFSESIIERFFRPFFGGIFFDKELGTTSRLFYFIFNCLALGDNTLPKKGIRAIPDQLAGKLPPRLVLLNSRFVSVKQAKNGKARRVRLEDGRMLEAELGVIVAVEEPGVDKILAGMRVSVEQGKRRPCRSTVCLNFTADRDQVPVQEQVLFLNGSGKGIMNNIFLATNVAPSYSVPGKVLVSVSLIGLFEDVADEELVAWVVRELLGWFNELVVGSWTHLRTYRIGFAQPTQCPPTDLMKDPWVGPGLYACGDYLTSATFDGALVSGRKAVECLLRDRVFSTV